MQAAQHNKRTKMNICWHNTPPTQHRAMTESTTANHVTLYCDCCCYWYWGYCCYCHSWHYSMRIHQKPLRLTQPRVSTTQAHLLLTNSASYYYYMPKHVNRKQTFDRSSPSGTLTKNQGWEFAYSIAWKDLLPLYSLKTAIHEVMKPSIICYTTEKFIHRPYKQGPSLDSEGEPGNSKTHQVTFPTKAVDW